MREIDELRPMTALGRYLLGITGRGTEEGIS